MNRLAKSLTLKEYQEPYNTCKKCEKQFKSESHLVRHVREKHLGKTFQCQFCDRYFTQNARLQIHIRSIHYGVKHECPFDLCESVHEASAELKKHLAKRHQMVDPELSQVVQESIANVKQKYNEMKTKIPKPDTENDQKVEDIPQENEIPKSIDPYKCETCGLSLASEKLIQMHKVVVHQ